MSKNKETVVEAPVLNDPFQYGYTPGTLVTLPAGVFAAALQFIGSTAQEEITERIVFNRFNLEKGPELDADGKLVQHPQEVILSISKKGKQAEEIFNEFMNVHISNIEQGLAVEFNNEETPKLDLGK